MAAMSRVSILREGAADTELLKPAAENLLQRWPVSKRVNSSRAPDDDPTLFDPFPYPPHDKAAQRED
jgi:hypothetical protein